MTRLQRIAAISLVVSFAAGGSAFAQQPQSQTPANPPAMTKSSPATTDKAAISKACTDQANAKGLHGKARKHFRAQCKKNGGKAQ